MFSKIIKPKTRKYAKPDGTEGASTDNTMAPPRNPINAARLATGNNAARSSIPPLQSYAGSSAVLPAGGSAVLKVKPSMAELPNGNGAAIAPSLSSEPMPALRDVPSSERQGLFLKKVSLCSVIFDFTYPTKDVKEKEMKRQTLLELVDHVTVGTTRFTEPVVEECFKMIRANIFRALPTAHLDTGASGEGFDVDEEEPASEPSWTHLQLVYEFLLRYVNASETDLKVAKKFVDHSFVVSLLDLFDSEDPRERDFVKTILHRIYGKFMSLRHVIRKSINSIFFRFIYETERHNGIAELLEIMGSIINGFALPLKEEHKLFLVRALIPLHKPKCVALYQQQLSYCTVQFVEKDFKLADIAIRGLLKFWPVTNSQKEVLFLGELEELLEVTQPTEFQRCMIPLFKQIARCLNSLHFQVAERTLFFWNNDHIVNLIAQNRHVILPLIFAALEKNTCSHWNLTVNGLTSNVRKMFQDLDQELFQECQKKHQEGEEQAKAIEDKREMMWHRLEMLAASKPLQEPSMLMATPCLSNQPTTSFVT